MLTPGYSGISQGECESSGCCWDDSAEVGIAHCISSLSLLKKFSPTHFHNFVPQGIPWCFHETYDQGESCSSVEDRVECGEAQTGCLFFFLSLPLSFFLSFLLTLSFFLLPLSLSSLSFSFFFFYFFLIVQLLCRILWNW